MTTTLFSWGYFGWGNATDRLIRIVDAIERERGFDPPLFADTRIRRSVRARGFQGSAFAERLGPARHRWMRGLGNEAIRTGEGGIRISDPAQADELLGLALADGSRRVIFFCSCQWPMRAGTVVCHRRVVGDLVLDAAGKRAEDVEVVEWPGGEPGEAAHDVTPEVLASVRRGRAAVPLGPSLPVAELRAAGWGSVVRLCCGDEAKVVTGPARFRAGTWELPVLELLDEDEEAEARGHALRRSFGLERRKRICHR
jgi:hypothetical protein